MGRIRDYEITKRDEPNEIVLTFFDGTDPVDPVVEYERAKKRRENPSMDVDEVKEAAEDEDDDDDDDLFGDDELAQEANGEKDPVSSGKDAVAEPLSTMTKRKAAGVYYGKIVSRVHVRKRRMMVSVLYLTPFDRSDAPLRSAPMTTSKTTTCGTTSFSRTRDPTHVNAPALTISRKCLTRRGSSASWRAGTRRWSGMRWMKGWMGMLVKQRRRRSSGRRAVLCMREDQMLLNCQCS